MLKHEDGSVFGPITFALLAEWEQAAQISPQDKTSTDGASWTRAPMLPELRMDRIVQVNARQCNGPMTLEAVRGFLEQGEIALDTELINACDGSVHRVGELPFFTAPEVGEPAASVLTALDDLADERSASVSEIGDSIFTLQRRIQSLEEALSAERRALAELRERRAKLQTQSDAAAPVD